MSQVFILVESIDVSSVQFNLIIDNSQCHHSDKSREEQVHHNHLQHHHHHGGQCHGWCKTTLCAVLATFSTALNTLQYMEMFLHKVQEKAARQPHVQYLQLLVLH